MKKRILDNNILRVCLLLIVLFAVFTLIYGYNSKIDTRILEQSEVTLCNHFGDADGSCNVGVPDLDRINGILAEDLIPCEITPLHTIPDCMNLDMDGNGVIGVPDSDLMLSGVISGEYRPDIAMPSGLEVINQNSNSITLRVNSEGFAPRAGIVVCVNNCDGTYGTPTNINGLAFNTPFEISNSAGEVTFSYNGAPGAYNIMFKTLGSEIGGGNIIPEVSAQATINIFPPCIPDCSNRCLGWSDGCGGYCPANNGASCKNPSTGLPGSCSGSSCADPTLKLYYNFDGGTATDLSGNGNTGTIYGSPTFLSTGGIKNTGAFLFDGVNDYINLNQITGIPARQQPITIAAWIKINSIPTGTNSYKAISRWDDYQNKRDWMISVNPTQSFNFYIGTNNNNKVYMAGSSLISKDIWYHVAGVYSGGTDVKLYINGVSTVGTDVGWGTTVTGNQITIGAGQYSTSRVNYFNGIIDEVMIFNRALTANEIQTIYAL